MKTTRQIPTEKGQKSIVDHTDDSVGVPSWRTQDPPPGRLSWSRLLRKVEQVVSRLTLKTDHTRLAEETLGRELARYPGRWVAVKDHHVVAVGDSMAELRVKTAGRSIDRRFRVPAGPGRTLLSRYDG